MQAKFSVNGWMNTTAIKHFHGSRISIRVVKILAPSNILKSGESCKKILLIQFGHSAKIRLQ